MVDNNILFGVVIDRESEPFKDNRVIEALELAENNPEVAKQLLRSVGYPNGFRIKLDCQPLAFEQLQRLLPFWGNIGVEAQLEVVE